MLVRGLAQKPVAFSLPSTGLRTKVHLDSAGMNLYRLSITVTSLALIVLGIAIVVRTALAGGGFVGFLIGPLFAVAGLGRLYLMRHR